MSEEKKENGSKKPDTGFRWVIPFFVVLALLTAVAFMVPLRPTVSYSEKRELAKFPEFSMSTLISGDYFDEITLWFSDTFPGREQWISLSADVKALYGSSDVYVAPAVPETMPAAEPETIPAATAPAQMAAPAADNAEAAAPADAETEQATEPTQWSGEHIGAEEEIALGAVIQIGDTAFNQLGFSEGQSRRYSASLNRLADALAGTGVRVVSAPAPTAVGIMVEPDYLEKLNCYPQDAMQAFLHDGMSDQVVKVDVVSNLLRHNQEYIYFRTDHHWTALGAYYAYEAVCEALGETAAPLDSFTPWDQGVFTGSLYGQAKWPHKLKKDDCIAYIPQGDITMLVLDSDVNGYEMPLLRDMTNANENEKYLTFLSSDHALVEITNESLPDAGNCLVIKDSFGNCFAPYLTQNYHKVYALDYRKYYTMGLSQFVKKYQIQDVIVSPYLIATQSILGNDLFQGLCW